MKLVVLQPSYLPWLGAMDQYAWSDTFVIYDDVQFEKNGYRNRNRILTSQGPQWLTVPVKVRNFPDINAVEIDRTTNWPKKHLESIRQAYAKTPYFDWLFPALRDYISRDFQMLVDLNVEGLRLIGDMLGLPWRGVLSSTLDIPGRRTERLIAICKRFNATDYLTGDSASSYLIVPEFDQIGVRVHWHGYKHPTYAQGKNEFVSNMSVIDLMFWMGPASLETLVMPRP
jgi:hypothetical protein